MSKYLLGFDKEKQRKTVWHQQHDGTILIESIQDNTDLIELNKKAQSECNTWNPTKDMKLVARIPVSVIALWQQMYGIDYWDQDPAVQKRIDRLLDSNEWRYLRTDDSVLS